MFLQLSLETITNPYYDSGQLIQTFKVNTINSFHFRKHTTVLNNTIKQPHWQVGLISHNIIWDGYFLLSVRNW